MTGTAIPIYVGMSRLLEDLIRGSGLAVYVFSLMISRWFERIEWRRVDFPTGAAMSTMIRYASTMCARCIVSLSQGQNP